MIKNILRVLVITSLIYLAGYFINKHNDKKKLEIVKGNHKLAIGYFKEIWEAGVIGTTYVKCTFNVNGKKYECSAPRPKRFPLCKWKKGCDTLKFNILYLVEDPDKNLMDPRWRGKFYKDSLPIKNFDIYKL